MASRLTVAGQEISWPAAVLLRTVVGTSLENGHGCARADQLSRSYATSGTRANDDDIE
jgi:hypothetical protein